MIDEEITKLVSHVAKKASAEGTDAPPFSEKVDALKAITAYYAILTKYKKNPSSEDDDDTPNFADFISKVDDEVKNGRSEIRSDRRARKQQS